MKKALLLVTVLVMVMVAVAMRGRLERFTPPAMSAATPDADWTPVETVSNWRCIVIHHSGTEVGGAVRFDESARERGTDELGYHFVIGNGSDTTDGQIEATPRWTAQEPGDHVRSADNWFNEHGIGICLVGNLDQYAPSRAQGRSLERLVKYLCKQYAIPPERVYTHAEATGKVRCPGTHFDIQKLRASVR